MLHQRTMHINRTERVNSSEKIRGAKRRYKTCITKRKGSIRFHGAKRKTRSMALDRRFARATRARLVPEGFGARAVAHSPSHPSVSPRAFVVLSRRRSLLFPPAPPTFFACTRGGVACHERKARETNGRRGERQRERPTEWHARVRNSEKKKAKRRAKRKTNVRMIVKRRYSTREIRIA